MWELLAKAACYGAGVTALASAALYGLWAACVWQGKVLVIRSDHLFCFLIVSLLPLLLLMPALFVYCPRSPLGWVAVTVFAYEFFALAQQALRPVHVLCYNVNEGDVLLSVRRVLVLAGVTFRERDVRVLAKDNTPLAEVVFETDRPEGRICMLPAATLRLYRLFAVSCMQSAPTPGASALCFALRCVEMLCVGGAALCLALLVIG